MQLAVIGERFIDRYRIGTMTRLSAEAPLGIVDVSELIEMPGGAGNVAATLKALGAEVLELHPPCHYPVKNRVMVDGVQICRFDEDDWVEEFNYTQFRIHAAALAKCDGIIISDYAKGSFSNEAIGHLSKALPLVPLFIDTKQDPDKFVRLGGSIQFFFPNYKEYLTHIAAYSALPHVIRKDGADGMKYYGPQHELIEEPAYATNVVSVNGAGDCVIAGFAHAYLTRPNVNYALFTASQTVAQAIQRPYTVRFQND